MNENQNTTLTTKVGGAQKVYWIYKKNGQETQLAADQLTLNYVPGHITDNDSAIIQFKAITPGDLQTARAASSNSGTGAWIWHSI